MYSCPYTPALLSLLSVTKSAEKHGQKHSLVYLNVTETAIYACDSHRLVKVDLDRFPEGLTPGLYKVLPEGKGRDKKALFIPASETMQYPNCEQVIPSKTKGFDFKADIDAQYGLLLMTMTARLLDNAPFISQAVFECVSLCELEGWHVVAGKGAQYPVKLTAEGVTIVLMPVRREDMGFEAAARACCMETVKAA